jgi:hypothetical protein
VKNGRKIITRVIVFVLLGAIVNVAVAWGLWMLPMPKGGTFFLLTPGAAEVRWWRDHAPAGFADAPSAHFDQRSFGRCLTDMNFEQAAGPGVAWQRHVALRRRAGWPMLTMEGATWSNPLEPSSRLQRHGLFFPPSGWPNAATMGIPYVPIWRNFAINTLFYAAILWLLFAAPFALRRRSRIKRGLCLACGYPIGESDVCTECGARVARPHGND